jgi:methylglutaconyl-CoA hydratase
MTGGARNLTMTIDGAVATITFQRPQKSNAYNSVMLRALDDCISRAGDDAAVRIVVLRGEGKHFCAGADLSAEAAQADTAAPDVVMPNPGDVCLRLSELAKPTVALVQGACIGGGMAFVTCCDIVIATEDAFFSMPEVRLGFSPTSLIPFVLQALGERHARRVLMSGARLQADEALRIGLATGVYPRDNMEKALSETIACLLHSAPGAVATVKSQIARLRHRQPTPDLLAELQQEFDALKDSAERKEGQAAMREKRRPKWDLGTPT